MRQHCRLRPAHSLAFSCKCRSRRAPRKKTQAFRGPGTGTPQLPPPLLCWSSVQMLAATTGSSGSACFAPAAGALLRDTSPPVRAHEKHGGNEANQDATQEGAEPWQPTRASWPLPCLSQTAHGFGHTHPPAVGKEGFCRATDQQGRPGPWRTWAVPKGGLTVLGGQGSHLIGGTAACWRFFSSGSRITKSAVFLRMNSVTPPSSGQRRPGGEKHNKPNAFNP